jgi:hypothetical protein
MTISNDYEREKIRIGSSYKVMGGNEIDSIDSRLKMSEMAETKELSVSAS